MNDYSPPPPVAVRGTSRLATTFAALVVLLCLVTLWRQYPRWDAVFTADRVFFVDPDDYTRARRAEQLISGPARRIVRMPEMNYPVGLLSHWTLPMDYFLAASHYVFGAVVPHNDQPAAAFACLPALVGLVFVAGLAWFVQRAAGTAPAILSGFLVVLSPAFYRVFQLGHPDHHCLLELLLLVSFGCWWRVGNTENPEHLAADRASAIASGLSMGLAIWVAAQALLFWGILLAGLTAACWLAASERRRAFVRLRLWWGGGVAFVVAVGFLVENWPELNAVAIDRISALHVAAVAVGLLTPARGLPPRRAWILRVCFVALSFGLIVWVAANREDVFRFVRGDAFYRWSAQIAELQPLVTRIGPEWSFEPMHARLGLLPYVFPPLWWFFMRSERVSLVMKAALGPGSAVVLALTLLQLRWLDHFGWALTPVAGVGAWELMKGRTRRDGLGLGRLASAGAFLAVVMAPAAWWVLTLTPERAAAAGGQQARTEFAARRIATHEEADPSGTSHRRAILCDEGEGPALMYWTGLPVVAAPYHRGLQGVLEAAEFFAERDPQAARDRLDRLGVRYIVVPMRPHEQLMQFEQLAFGEWRSFDPPIWERDATGRWRLQPRYRPEVVQTLAYRLALADEGEVIPGVTRIANLLEGSPDAPERRMKTGLVFVVDDLPTPEHPATARQGEEPSPP